MKTNNKLLVNMQKYFYGMAPDDDFGLSMLIEKDGIKIDELWLVLDEVLKEYAIQAKQKNKSANVCPS